MLHLPGALVPLWELEADPGRYVLRPPLSSSLPGHLPRESTEILLSNVPLPIIAARAGLL